jgi:hypothetical protein
MCEDWEESKKPPRTLQSSKAIVASEILYPPDIGIAAGLHNTRYRPSGEGIAQPTDILVSSQIGRAVPRRSTFSKAFVPSGGCGRNFYRRA